MGLEGIVSKRKNSAYASRDWLKSKNPDCAAARRKRTGATPAASNWQVEKKVPPNAALLEKG
jgi:ATP-dependent DNA ligase